jgi:hypothetical protein
MTAVSSPAVDAVPVASTAGMVVSRANFPPRGAEAVEPAENRARTIEKIMGGRRCLRSGIDIRRRSARKAPLAECRTELRLGQPGLF